MVLFSVKAISKNDIVPFDVSRQKKTRTLDVCLERFEEKNGPIVDRLLKNIIFTLVTDRTSERWSSEISSHINSGKHRTCGKAYL